MGSDKMKKAHYHNHKTRFDFSSGEYRTVYYFFNGADGYYECLDVFWEREYYRVLSTPYKPTYGKTVNLKALQDVDIAILKSMPWEIRERYCKHPFDDVKNLLDRLGFQRVEQWSDNDGAWHNRPWSREISRF